MFAPTDFDTQPQRPKLEKARSLGLTLLLGLFVMCLLLALAADQEIFVPFNTAVAQTETVEAGGTSRRTPTRQPAVTRPTPTSLFEQKIAEKP